MSTINFFYQHFFHLFFFIAFHCKFTQTQYIAASKAHILENKLCNPLPQETGLTIPVAVSIEFQLIEDLNI